MREVVFTFIIVAFLIGSVNTIWAFHAVRKLAERQKTVKTWDEFKRVRDVVAWQMYARLIDGGVLFFVYLIVGIGMIFEAVYLHDLPAVITLTVLLLALVLYKRKYDKLAHEVPVSHELDPEYKHVLRTWDRHALPDW